jgi:hypothetical protein
MPDGRGVATLKALILTFAALLFLAPLATRPGLVFGLLGTFAGALLAYQLAGSRLRLVGGLAVGGAVALVGSLVDRVLVSWASFLDPSFTLQVADVFAFGLGALGVSFVICLLSRRVRGFAVLELVLVVAAVGHTFSEHRHQRIHQPRFLSDWAWSNGVDPQVMLTAVGVLAVALAAVLLLRARRGAWLLGMLLLLVLLFGATAAVLAPEHLGGAADTNDLGLTKDDEKKNDQDKKDGNGNGGGGSSNKPPDPVALAILHDDLPDVDLLYFRQSVRSRLVGDRLIEDTSGRFDTDLLTGVPSGAPLELTTPQAPAFHRGVRTSMFLLVDHAQWPGLGAPDQFAPLQNPNPRRFVAAYDVHSQLLLRPPERLVGRQAVPDTWTAAQREHYLAVPNDPRYRELSNQLVREVDPRFVGDDVVKAMAIRQYLEKNGFYSLKQKTLEGEDPTAKFLFGDLKGYCVHFAHAAVFLLRSQGLPARVALGYGVQTSQRGAGSAVLIYGNEAHAWPELYLDGVGWVTFDIAPQESDEPTLTHVDVDLAAALGEVARNDPTGGKADPGKRWSLPWGPALLTLLGGVLLAAYVVKVTRRLRRGSPRLVYRGVLDRLSDHGVPRQFGESRERHATRLALLTPSFVPLTAAHLKLSLGGDSPEVQAQLDVLALATARELRRNTPWHTRATALLNPVGWWFTR